MARPRRLLFILLALFAIPLVLPSFVELGVDWLWFSEIGFQDVLRAEIAYRSVLFTAVGVFSFAFLYLNLRYAQRGVVPNPAVLKLNDGEVQVNVAETLRKLQLPVSLFLALLMAAWAGGEWREVLRWRHRVAFGTADPIFGRDIGFYVFDLPILANALGLLFTLVVLSLILTVPVYWLRRDIIVNARLVRLERSTQLHLGALLAAGFLLMALRMWLVETPELLFSRTGPLVGASYTDLHAELPALRVLTFAAVGAAIAVFVGALRQSLVGYAALSMAIYFALVVLGRGLIPSAVQNFVVEPTELTREAPQLRHHIAATRQAWDIEDVEVRDLTGEAALTLGDIQDNASTIRNVRLWDRDPLLQTFGQLQEIRTYYDFVSVDDDRYWIDGEYRQVLLSPRELNPAALPTRTFINEHLTFTHGMGLTLGPVNRRTAEGLPVLFIQDLPPESNVSLDVTRPQIYYGELTQSPVFVKTLQREFDYPAGDENIFTSYEGDGGVRLGGWWRRALFATYLGSSKVLLSGDLQDESRVLYHRQILSRAARALPFLEFDNDPYLVIAEDGTLQWMLDAYTTTSLYPYAQRLRDGTSYMRNSVKVVIDAYHGTITPYIFEPDDPIVRTYDRAFPGLFREAAEMPADLRQHVRYAEDLYRVQTTLHTVYHMDEAEEFYHREDEWQIPVLDEGDRESPFMRRIVMRLPEEEEPEFIFMTPFTPRQKDNLAAWMVARSDGEHYGTLRVYRFPKQSLVFGPRQVVNRINQDTEIARQISLWDQRGSEVIRGELLVLPIEEALLYVQPLYLRAEGGRIPELKRVILAYQNQVVMEETLEAGLAALFGGAAAPAEAEPGEEPPVVPEGEAAPMPDVRLTNLLERARDHYARAVAAQRTGDWATYGTEIEQLGQLLNGGLE